MNNLEKVYHIVGIVQRVAMVILTFLIMGVAYKVLSLTGKFQISINELHDTVNKLYILIDKSWLF